MYPHHGTHGLALPFGWTNDVPTKPSYCHDTLPATPTNSPLGYVLGGPVPTKGTNGHRRGKMVPNGDKDPYKNNGHTRIMPSYLAKVAPAHNLPSREAPVRATTKDRIKTFQQGKCGRTELKPDSVAP